MKTTHAINLIYHGEPVTLGLDVHFRRGQLDEVTVTRIAFPGRDGSAAECERITGELGAILDAEAWDAIREACAGEVLA